MAGIGSVSLARALRQFAQQAFSLLFVYVPYLSKYVSIINVTFYNRGIAADITERDEEV